MYGLRMDRTLLGLAGLFDGAAALEPGGPSALFGEQGLVPVYPRLAALDTLDYAERTLWSDGPQTEKPELATVRRRLIGEASHLGDVPDDAYDAVLSSHVLEHLANPLGALVEWQRIVRPGGHVLLIVPHRDGTFDHRRPVTTLAHLRQDAARETGEDDLTHLQEILSLHDLDRDPGAPSREVFEERCRAVASTRALHHHVFVSETVLQACVAAGLEVLLLRPKHPLNIVCLCRVGKASSAAGDGADSGPSEAGDDVGSGPGPAGSDAGSGPSKAELSRILRRSPFPSDRRRSS
jgi:SAM-dependent methyltransferase